MNSNIELLNSYRIKDGFYKSIDDVKYGLFEIKINDYTIRIISSGDDLDSTWEHVSVSKYKGRKNYMPTWEDMCGVKGLFWSDDETVIQFHPKKSEYVNCHPKTLHLWKRVDQDHELPPSILVGPKTVSPEGFKKAMETIEKGNMKFFTERNDNDQPKR